MGLFLVQYYGSLSAHPHTSQLIVMAKYKLDSNPTVYAFMFGLSWDGCIGLTEFAPNLGNDQFWRSAFVLFQITFCGTAATILAGQWPSGCAFLPT